MTAAVQRYLRLLGETDPIEVLSSAPGRIEAWLERVPAGTLDEPSSDSQYGPDGPGVEGARSPRELLASLADFELVSGFRLRQLIAMPGIELQSIDRSGWSSRYRRCEPSLAFEAFRALRSWNLALLAGFSLEDWLAEGFHPERGFESCDQIVRQLAGHDLDMMLRLGIDLRGPSSRSSSR